MHVNPRFQITSIIVPSCIGLLVSLCSLPASSQSSPQEIHVFGTVQFWERDCATLKNCSLPVAISPHYPIDTRLKRPDNDHEISYWKGQFSSQEQGEQDALLALVATELYPQLTLEVYWRSAKDDPKNRYLSFQMLFMQHRHISSCSQYVAESEIAFPAGYCSVFILKDARYKQFGVSFYHANPKSSPAP